MVFEMHDIADPLTMPSRDGAHAVPPVRTPPYSTLATWVILVAAIYTHECGIGPRCSYREVMYAAPDVRVEAQLS